MSEAYERMRHLRQQRDARADEARVRAQNAYDVQAERARERMYDPADILAAEGIEAQPVYSATTIEAQDRPRSFLGMRPDERLCTFTFADHGWRLPRTKFLDRFYSDYADYDSVYPVLTCSGDIWRAHGTGLEPYRKTEFRGLTHGHGHAGHLTADALAHSAGQGTPIGDLDQHDLTGWYLDVVDHLHDSQH